MTLKTVLRNFLNHVESIETRHREGEGDQYEAEFQKLKDLTEVLKHDDDYLSSEGELDVNRRKNRYKDILPYDCSRVVLSEYPGVPGSDYINANYIKGASGSLAYIASQGPLPNTVVDFWRMIWECEVQVIVMACNERESGKYKCECYWPNEGEQRQYGNITVEMVKWKQVCPDFLVRTLRSRCGDDERKICQFHYTTWPDHGVPSTVQPILDLVRLVRDCQASEALPVLVHCSAGCGRTGTVCAIDYVWGLMRLGRLQESFSLFDVISDMRRQRIAMVQTKEQYILVHHAVLALFEQQLRVIDTHTYENLDEDGEPLVLKELRQDDLSECLYEDVMSGHSDYRTEVVDSATLPVSKIEGKSSQDDAESVNGNNKKAKRNSQILQQLCREESVKRLISGWNKGVVKTDSQAYEGTPDLAPDKMLKNGVPDVSEVPQQSKPTKLQEDATTSKNSKQGGAKGEKLVGKATVIRRPSIARLKALFEKSHGSDSYGQNSDSRRRRPLGRSHTLHAPRGCSSPSSDDSDTRRMVERVLRLSQEPQQSKKRGTSAEPGDSQTVSFSAQQVAGFGEESKCETHVERFHRKMSDGCSHLEKTGSWYGDDPRQSSNVYASEPADHGYSQFGASVARSQSSSVVQPSVAEPLISKNTNVHPPELPTKKSVHKTMSNPLGKEGSVLSEDARTNVARVESIYDNPKSLRVAETPPQLPEKKNIGKLAASKLGLWNACDVTKNNLGKSKKNNLEIQRDMENARRIPSSNIHATAQSLVDRYTNVNLTTKKNIEQIENSIKQHPRGAIIDLTSRTSFVENGTRSAAVHVACNNNIQNSSEGYESVWVRQSTVGNNEDPQPRESKNHKNESAESDLNKNLLLHSPPPRTRRPHLGRSVSKTKNSEVQQIPDDMPNVSSDKEINKAVKDLNTIGYLLDALASQTLDDLKKENSILDESNLITKLSSSHSHSETNRPDLPVKQKSAGKRLDFSVLGDSGSSSSFPPSPQKMLGQSSFNGYSSVCSQQLSRELLEHRRHSARVDGADPTVVKQKSNSRTLMPPEYEYIYPLQKSASAPHSAIMFSDPTSSGPNNNIRHSVLVSNSGNYVCEDEFRKTESAPPKPPRTFAHVPQQRVGSGRFDGGRLLVSVASPKHVKSEEGKKHDTGSPKDKNLVFTYPERPTPVHPPSSRFFGSEVQPSPPPYKNAPNPIYNTSSGNEFDPQTGEPIRVLHRMSRHPSLPHSPPADRSHNAPPPNTHWNQDRTLQAYSATPEYGKIPVAPVYTTVRPDFDRHRVQWDRSVDAQQQVKCSKNYENIYDMPKECQQGVSRTVQQQGNNPLRHSQSDASVYAVLREMKQIEESQQPPLYSQVVKPRRRPDHRRSQDDMDIRPVAPPRNKKQVGARRFEGSSSPDDGGFSIHPNQQGRGTWHSDSEDEPPAVPVKTKGAYIPVDAQSPKACLPNPKKAACASGPQGGLGGTLSRALGKLTLLTKLTGKEQNNHHMKYGQAPPCPTKPLLRDSSPAKKTPHGLRSPVFGFPHRLHRKPKGPREPTEQWTQV